MGKKEKHREELLPVFKRYFKTQDPKPLFTYLQENSSLPGRRANLELGQVFADMCREFMPQSGKAVRQLIDDCIAITIAEAPVNSAGEFVPFCGTIALGLCAAVDEAFKEEALEKLKIMANDGRWRIREAVSKGLSAMLRVHRSFTLNGLESWIGKDNWLHMRGVAAGVASPSLLAEDRDFAEKALAFHETICQNIHNNFETKSDDFMALRKGAGFTLSVVVCGVPDKGFALMKRLLEYNDPNLNWIVKENLKKKRLAELAPAAVEELKSLL